MLLNETSQQKIKKLRDSGRFCCIQIKSDYNYVWDIYLIEANNSKHEVKFRSGSYEDLDDAVNDIYQQVEGLIGK